MKTLPVYLQRAFLLFILTGVLWSNLGSDWRSVNWGGNGVGLLFLFFGHFYILKVSCPFPSEMVVFNNVYVDIKSGLTK